jgi:hypothetical protein
MILEHVRFLSYEAKVAKCQKSSILSCISIQSTRSLKPLTAKNQLKQKIV